MGYWAGDGILIHQGIMFSCLSTGVLWPEWLPASCWTRLWGCSEWLFGCVHLLSGQALRVQTKRPSAAPGFDETWESAVSARPGSHDRGERMSVYKSCIGACSFRQPITASVWPGWISPINQTSSFCMRRTWPAMAWLSRTSRFDLLVVRPLGRRLMGMAGKIRVSLTHGNRGGETHGNRGGERRRGMNRDESKIYRCSTTLH